jgi:hypothetical protein
MIERTAKIARIGSPPAQHDKLPYRIELCGEDKNVPERVLALALNSALARAIFKAARKEYPGRRLLLRRGDRTVADSAE